MIQVSPDTDDVRQEVIIIGASARAAAFSARRSGLTPICIDRFADLDLQQVADATRVTDYPAGILTALQAWEHQPALYVGGIENHTTLVQQLAASRPLFGNSVEILARVRDPFQLSAEFAKARFPCLEVRPTDEPPPRDEQWLLKPLKGTGGRGIAVWDKSAGMLDEPGYFQRRQSGDSHSAVFVAPAGTTDVRFVGMTRQLDGAELLGAPQFAWCGSVGPVTLGIEAEHMVRRIGNFLSWRFGLCGLFGFDFILDDAEVPWVTEVNPRYPASAEVLEHVCGLTLIGDHCRAFCNEWPPLAETPPNPVHAMGKFVLYARAALEVPEPDRWLLNADLDSADLWQRTPRIADIPPAGTRLQAGEPMCTLFTTGQSRVECLEQLPPLIQDTESRLLV